MASPLLTTSTAAAAAATKFIPNYKVWNLLNLDSGQVMQGQFEAENVGRDIEVNWGQFTSLNRQNPILQFLNGAAEKVSFDARFYSNHALDASPEAKLEMLVSWTKIDPSLRRPPILQFWIGDGHLMMNCVVTGAKIGYARPNFFGGARDITFTLSLMEFTPFSLDDAEQTDTRYARARDRDYFELLAFEEYGNPMIGDVIRKMHPILQSLEPGDVVKLPSIEGVRSKRVMQTSIPLKSAFGREDTPQRRLRLQFFQKRSGNYVSHVLSPTRSSSRSVISAVGGL
jgi:hypothetical protein